MIVRVDRVIESPLEVTRCTGHHKSPMSCKSTLLTRWNRRLNLRLMPWSGPVISDHSDHGRSNEPMNPLWTRIHRLIWSTMIRLISERNAPLAFLKVLCFSFPVPVVGPNAKMTSLDEDNKSSFRSLAHFATKKRKTLWFALLRPTLKQTPPTLKREK